MQLHTEFDDCALNTHKSEAESASPGQPIGIGLSFAKLKPCSCGVSHSHWSCLLQKNWPSNLAFGQGIWPQLSPGDGNSN